MTRDWCPVEGGTFRLAANTVAAYRRDLEGVARRIAVDAEVGVLHAEVGVLHLEHLTKEALRWSCRRCWVTPRWTPLGATSTPPPRGSARWSGVTLARWRSGSICGEAEPSNRRVSRRPASVRSGQR
ncbi:MAG TPA: hypothetical protein VGR26_15840 [Acidimicrobiales bacterium]|nr:hypothetical protein [Acidimicrobiales bacterium]